MPLDSFSHVGDIAAYVPPVLVFVVFFVLLRRQEPRPDRSKRELVADVPETLREAGRNPRGWVGMAGVVGVFLVAVPLDRSLGDRPPDEQMGYALVCAFFVLLLGIAFVVHRRHT